VADLRETLHDRIDSQESLRERAAEAVERVKPRLVEIVRGIDDPGDDDAMERVLEIVAAAVEQELARITTKAVHSGRDFAVRVSRG
jgi:hypothetical protein